MRVENSMIRCSGAGGSGPPCQRGWAGPQSPEFARRTTPPLRMIAQSRNTLTPATITKPAGETGQVGASRLGTRAAALRIATPGMVASDRLVPEVQTMASDGPTRALETTQAVSDPAPEAAPRDLRRTLVGRILGAIVILAAITAA